MRLKSLKLAGFKSFANPTTFTFRHGITAIVGPNGCGKSNVIDAIRWVLGESSAKQLRGGAMSDVIFAGTESKSAKSLASVELTFQHTQDEQTGIRHELNIYHELSVRRQINADGKSDYFINGTRCRRRDVVDVFLGTGLGPRSYSVIQQGMIGRIVDSSPLQLREFIEEAAGVSRYQARREETQKKLLKTRENLDRLTDIESELTRQKQKLAKQADNATQYQHIKDELDHVKEQLVTYQLYEAKAAQLEHKEAQKTLEKSVTELQQDDAKLRQKLTKSAERLSEEQWLKDQARDNLHEQDMQRQQVEHKRTTLQTSLNQLESRLQTNIEKQQYTQESIAEAEQENETQSANVSRLSPQLDKLKQQQKQRQAQYGPLQAALESNNAQVSKIENNKRELEQQIALGQQAYKRLQLDQDKWQSRDNAWAQEAAKWGLAGEQDKEGISTDDRGASGDMSSASIDAQIAELDKTLSGLDKQQESIDDSLDIEQPALKQRQASLNEQQAKFAALEKQYASLMAEYETLHAIVHPRKKQSSTESKPADVNGDASVSGTTSVDNALQSLKPLHQQIKLTKAGEAHASALDKWLAFWLDARVFDTADSSDDALNNLLADLLTSRSDGLNTNATSDKKNNKKANKQSKEQTQANSVFYATKGNALEGTDKEAATALLNDYPELKVLSQLIAAPKLDVLQRVYLYTGSELTQDDAKQLIAALPKQSILLTPAGWIMSHVGAIHLSKLGAGSQNEQFLSVRLQQTQRLAELEEALNDIEAEIETLDKSIKADSAKQEQAAIFVEELTAQLAALTHKRHEIKQQRVELAAKQERQRSEQTRLKQQRTELDTERQEIEQELIELTKKEAEYKERLEALEPLLTAAKEKQQQLEQERVENNQKERDDNDAMRQLQLEFSQAELGSKHSHQQIKQLTKDIERLKQAHKRLIEERETANAELPKLDTELKKMNASYHEMKVALDERNAIITALQTEVNEQQAKRDALSLELTQRQEKLANSVTQVAIADERINEASERLKVLNAEANPVALINDYVANGRRVPDEDVQKLQEQEKQLTHKLENMGPVNLAAVAELEAVDERLLPLEQQINDITASMDKLTEAIASIDTKTKALFTETLNSVNKSLNSLFTKVFNGGQASLTLVKDDTLEKGEQWRAGLELMAQPKGKRNSRLAVLSGGEKTLTALSLIFAIFKQHPAPFCVLDEVDAPLDDANVARFTSLIAELADDVQFIFISHNKLAMQIADELKGITMPQAGISTLVSVSLEEAEQYLEPTA